jgi:hypothetical protein
MSLHFLLVDRRCSVFYAEPPFGRANAACTEGGGSPRGRHREEVRGTEAQAHKRIAMRVELEQ